MTRYSVELGVAATWNHGDTGRWFTHFVEVETADSYLSEADLQFLAQRAYEVELEYFKEQGHILPEIVHTWIYSWEISEET